MFIVWLMHRLDWRMIWVGCALVALFLIPFLMRLLEQERTPQSIAEETQATGMNGRHWLRGDVLRHWLFWMMVPATLAPSMFVTALFFHQVHLAGETGWSHAEFVLLIPVYTVSSVVCAIVFGWRHEEHAYKATEKKS